MAALTRAEKRMRAEVEEIAEVVGVDVWNIEAREADMRETVL